MKKLLAIVLSALMLTAVFANGAKEGSSEGSAIEPNAKIVFSCDTDAWGEAVVALWDKTYPKLAGVVSYEHNGTQGATDMIGQLQGDAPDVMLAIDEEVSRQSQSLKELSPAVAAVSKQVSQPPFYETVNTGYNLYVPIGYNGLVFGWNKTMMDALGMDTTDANADGLPDAFDTWEEIFAWSKVNTGNVEYKGKTINVCFPLPLGNQWSTYSTFTCEGWNIYSTGDATKPGFDDPKFLKSLDFIAAAADARLSVEANGSLTPAESMAERGQDFINSDICPFCLVGTWQDVNSAEATLGEDFKFSTMPTWNGNHMSPFVTTKGFVINGFTSYPLACDKLMKLLLNTEGMQVMVENSSYIPALVAGAPNTPDFSNDSNKKEMLKGFAYNYPTPSLSLPNNPAMSAITVFYNIAIEQSYYGIWDGTRTAKEVQDEIVANAAAWLATNN